MNSLLIKVMVDLEHKAGIHTVKSCPSKSSTLTHSFISCTSAGSVRKSFCVLVCIRTGFLFNVCNKTFSRILHNKGLTSLHLTFDNYIQLEQRIRHRVFKFVSHMVIGSYYWIIHFLQNITLMILWHMLIKVRLYTSCICQDQAHPFLALYSFFLISG